MFNNLEAFGILWVMRAAEEENRRVHAHQVTVDLGLDPRLERFIPMRPTRRRHVRTYDDLLEMLSVITALPEPERTSEIEQVARAVEARRK